MKSRHIRIEKHRPGVCLGGACSRECLQGLLVGLNHLLDHLAADGAGLPGGQVTVVTFLQVDTHLP